MYLSNILSPECTKASTSSEGYSDAIGACSLYFARSCIYQLIASSVAPFSQSHQRYFPLSARGEGTVAFFLFFQSASAKFILSCSLSNGNEYWSISNQDINIASNCDVPRFAASYSLWKKLPVPFAVLSYTIIVYGFNKIPEHAERTMSSGFLPSVVFHNPTSER